MGVTVKKVKVVHGKDVKIPSSPVKEGFNFHSWNTKEDGTGETAVLTNITQDMTVYAKYVNFDALDSDTWPNWLMLTYYISDCGVVLSRENIIGYHFFPINSGDGISTNDLTESSYIVLGFSFVNIGVVYFRIDTQKILLAMNNNVVYDMFESAKAYISGEFSADFVHLIPPLPTSSVWSDISTIPILSEMSLSLRDYSTNDHVMFSGNDVFNDGVVNVNGNIIGMSYTCKNI